MRNSNHKTPSGRGWGPKEAHNPKMNFGVLLCLLGFLLFNSRAHSARPRGVAANGWDMVGRLPALTRRCVAAAECARLARSPPDRWVRGNRAGLPHAARPPTRNRHHPHHADCHPPVPRPPCTPRLAVPKWFPPAQTGRAGDRRSPNCGRHRRALALGVLRFASGRPSVTSCRHLSGRYDTRS